MLLDIVFSLDSVITAVGMVDELWVMIAAVVISVALMMISAEPISAFVHKHPTVKILALAFLLLIGMSLLLEGFGQHIRKGYIYFAMGFSVLRGDGQSPAASEGDARALEGPLFQRGGAVRIGSRLTS